MPAASRVIKACKFEDGSFTIHAPVIPAAPVDSVALDPMAAIASRDAEAFVVSARLEADAIRQGAIQEADAITKRAHEAMAIERLELMAQSRKEGFLQGEPIGREAGYQAVVNQHAEFLVQLAASIEEDARSRESWFDSQETELVALALLIARKILHKEVTVTRASVVSLAKASLAHLHDKTQARVRVHPDDVAVLNDALGALKHDVSGLETLEIIADPHVGPGGCVAESKTGRVDANLATLLEEVAATLLDLPPGAGREALPAVLADVVAAPARPPRPPMRAPVAQPVMPVEPQGLAPREQAQAQEPALIEEQYAPPLEEQDVPLKEEETSLGYQETVNPKGLTLPAWMLKAAVMEPEPEASETSLEAPTDDAPGELSAAPDAFEPSWDTSSVPALEMPESSHALVKFQAPPKGIDPSQRAADALAFRLGKLKKGRGVSTLKEEVDMRHLEGEISDEALELIVKHVLNRPASELDSSTSLVYKPPKIEDAAVALADRLGKKKKGVRPWYDGLETLPDGPTEAQRAELNSALDDAAIDALIEKLTPTIGPLVSASVVETPPAAVEKTLETLAERLGKKKKSIRPWYESNPS
jgi:flagellar assembly protein FliH